jgi:hypothetical protein
MPLVEEPVILPAPPHDHDAAGGPLGGSPLDVDSPTNLYEESVDGPHGPAG